MSRPAGSPRLTVTLLGTGTSSGVPVIGCDCAVCTSRDPRNRRFRAGARIDLAGGSTLLVDTPTDLRQQALAFGLPRVDAVLYTHAHADHVFGLDDLRVFNHRQGGSIPCYGSERTLEGVRQSFHYVFEEGGEGGGTPSIEPVPVEGSFELGGVEVVPVPVLHGSLPIYGYRLGGFAYLTDVSKIPEPSFALLEDLEVLVLGALRYRPHPTHFSLAEAATVAERIGARRTFFTHLCHEVDHGDVQIPLPPRVELGHDGMVLHVG